MTGPRSPSESEMPLVMEKLRLPDFWSRFLATRDSGTQSSFYVPVNHTGASARLAAKSIFSKRENAEASPLRPSRSKASLDLSRRAWLTPGDTDDGLFVRSI